MKYIGIIGSRRRDTEVDFTKVRNALKKIYEKGDILVSGGCPEGGDKFANVIAKAEGYSILNHYPAWVVDDKYIRSAGYVRNGLIANDAQVLIACVAETRKGGTEDTIKKFLKKVGLTEEEAIKKGVLVLV